MALIFECIQTEGIAELSYLVGDDSEGVAAVFDPRPDVDCYLQLAREKQVSITHIFETHNHVDSLSGARELCARVDSAKIFLSHEGGARYATTRRSLTETTSCSEPFSLQLGTRPATRRSTLRIFSRRRITRTRPGACSPGTRFLSIPPGGQIWAESAIASGYIDFIFSPEGIAKEIVRIAHEE